MNDQHAARVGLFGVAHKPYWEQFPGLYESLMGYRAEIRKMLEARGDFVLDLGILDSSAAAYEAARKLKAADLDMVFVDMTTYATSSVFAPVLRDCGLPLVLLALQPRAGLDYTVANTRMQLENDNICSVPEFMNVSLRYGRPVEDVVIGKLFGDEYAEREIARWLSVARVLRALKGARLGLMGHVLEAMYDMHADPTALSASFGIHVPLLEIDDLLEDYDRVTDDEIAAQIGKIEALFDMPDPKSDPVTRKLTREDLLQSARSAAALDRFVERFSLTGLAYYYGGRENSPQREVASSLIVGNTLLQARGFPMCGEYDIKTCLAMLIMDRLGIGGSFAELHPFDFDGDFILVGHDGPHHIGIAEGRPALRSLTHYHGKPGRGASVEFKIKEGPITMLGITQTHEGTFKFIVGEGMSCAGPIPPTGNTNTRARFAPDTRTFIHDWVMEGPTHHIALGIGHHAEEIRRVAHALGIGCAVVGERGK